MQRPGVGCLARALVLAAALSLALASCARQHDRVHDSGPGGDVETTTTLAGGQTALVTESPKGTGVIWVEKLVPAAGLDTELVGYNMTIEVLGPAPDFTLEAAIAAANEFAISSKRVAQSG